MPIIHPDERMNRLASDRSVPEQLSSLAEPTRLRILRLLDREELSVRELGDVIQVPQSTVSRHLKQLSTAGWLTRRSVGTTAFYAMTIDDLEERHRKLWLAIKDDLMSVPEAEGDDVRLRHVLHNRATDSRTFFGRVAGEWDEVRASLFGPGFTSPALLSLIDPRWTVADLGCGTGNVAELISPCVKSVIAVDTSGPMLEAARKRLAGCGNVEFREGDLDGLPLADGSVDAGVISLVLHHLDDARSALRESFRVLRAGGLLVVIEMRAHDREEYKRLMGHKRLGFEPGELEALMTEIGFAGVSVRDLPAEPGTKGPPLLVVRAQRPA